MLKISIVTPTYNQGGYIRDCIESVLSQNYNNWEHIIIDGGSTDETISILNEYKHLKWISEKDSGAVNALNKGVKLSTGDVIGWLNSDDYYEKNIFQDVSNAFNELKDEFICGNLNFVDKYKNLIKKDCTFKSDLNYLVHNNPYVIRTPAAFYSKNIIEKVGYFNESYRIVFDYEMFLKILTLKKIKYIDKTFANYRFHETTLSSNNVKTQVCELLEISRNYGRKFYDPITFLLLKTLLKANIKSKFSLF